MRRLQPFAILFQAAAALSMGAGPVALAASPPTLQGGPIAPSMAVWSELPPYLPPPAYREVVVVQSAGKTIILNRAIDSGRVRTELSLDGKAIVLLEQGDGQGTSYLLIPDEKRAVKDSLQSAGDQPAAAAQPSVPDSTQDLPAELAVVDLGPDAIEGRNARKLRLVMPDGAVLAWFDPASGAPLRMESRVDGKEAILEWKDRQVGPQPPALFDVPADYEVLVLNAAAIRMGGTSGTSGPGAPSGKGGGLGGMAKNVAGGVIRGAGSNLGGQLGGQIGGVLGGPLGSIAGHYLGGKLGRFLGRRAAGAVTR